MNCYLELILWSPLWLGVLCSCRWKCLKLYFLLLIILYLLRLGKVWRWHPSWLFPQSEYYYSSLWLSSRPNRSRPSPHCERSTSGTPMVALIIVPAITYIWPLVHGPITLVGASLIKVIRYPSIDPLLLGDSSHRHEGPTFFFEALGAMCTWSTKC